MEDHTPTNNRQILCWVTIMVSIMSIGSPSSIPRCTKFHENLKITHFIESKVYLLQRAPSLYHQFTLLPSHFLCVTIPFLTIQLNDPPNSNTNNKWRYSTSYFPTFLLKFKTRFLPVLQISSDM